MFGLGRLELYGIAALVVCLAAAAFGFYEHHQGYLSGKKEVQLEFDQFKSAVTLAGQKAKQDALDKEKENDSKLRSAYSQRDVALGKLQVASTAPRSGFVPGDPAGAAGGDKVCYNRTALDGALRALDQGVSGLVNQGDRAVIDALTLLRAWPTGVR